MAAFTATSPAQATVNLLLFLRRRSATLDGAFVREDVRDVYGVIRGAEVSPPHYSVASPRAGPGRRRAETGGDGWWTAPFDPQPE